MVVATTALRGLSKTFGPCARSTTSPPACNPAATATARSERCRQARDVADVARAGHAEARGTTSASFAGEPDLALVLSTPAESWFPVRQRDLTAPGRYLIRCANPTGADHAIDILTTRFIARSRGARHGEATDKAFARAATHRQRCSAAAAAIAVSAPPDPDRASCVEQFKPGGGHARRAPARLPPGRARACRQLLRSPLRGRVPLLAS